MKQFILIFTDKTFSETNGANLEEMKDLYIGEVVRLQDRSLKKCIKVEDKEVFELKHRLAMIQDDISYLIKFIDDERLMERFDKYTEVSDSAWNLINNIDIASDLSRDDSLAWKKFNHKKNNNKMEELEKIKEDCIRVYRKLEMGVFFDTYHDEMLYMTESLDYMEDDDIDDAKEILIKLKAIIEAQRILNKVNIK